MIDETDPYRFNLVPISELPSSLRKIYIIGSLRNPKIPEVAEHLRENLPSDIEVFDDWYAAGEKADDEWKSYEEYRGRSYIEALSGHAANQVFTHDKKHLDEATDVILVCPAGKSGHLELGYSVGKGKNTYILLDDVNFRWDVMYKFVGHVCGTQEELLKILKENQ